MAGPKKWVRICAGTCKDDKCADLSGKSYPQNQEAEAKKKAHKNCQCTAKLVSTCEGAMGVGDLSIEASSSRSGRDVSITATVTNTGASTASNVQAEVEISAAGDDIHHETYDLGVIEAGKSKTKTDSFTIPYLKIIAVTKANGNNDVTTVATVDYDMNGKHNKKSNACYNAD